MSGHERTYKPGELLFATFRPPSESGVEGLAKLSTMEPELFKRFEVPKECRIVVTPDSRSPGQYVWTFVPLAKGRDALKDELSEWPRLVSVLGYVHFSCLLVIRGLTLLSKVNRK